MENMPENIIKKIYFFTTHPVADIVRASGIFTCLAHTNLKDDDISWDFATVRRDGSCNFEYYVSLQTEEPHLYTFAYQHSRPFQSVDPALNCRFRVKPKAITNYPLR